MIHGVDIQQRLADLDFRKCIGIGEKRMINPLVFVENTDIDRIAGRHAKLLKDCTADIRPQRAEANIQRRNRTDNPAFFIFRRIALQKNDVLDGISRADIRKLQPAGSD